MMTMLGKKYEKAAPDQASHTSDDPYRRLANGIILQAVRDFRTARKALETTDWDWLLLGINGKRKKEIKKIMDAHIETIEEVSEFFKSDYFMVLTNIDGTALLRQLEQENLTEEEQE